MTTPSEKGKDSRFYKRLTLDQAILWSMDGSLKSRPRRESLLTVAALLICTAGVIIDRKPIPSMASIALVMAAMGYQTWAQLKAESRRQKISDAVEWRVPISKLVAAHSMYDTCVAGDLAAWECHESHLPGDCPLCGAQ